MSQKKLVEKEANIVYALNEDFPADLFTLKFQKKFRQVEIFFYCTAFIHNFPLLPRDLLQMLYGLFLSARKLGTPISGIELSIINDGQISFLNSRHMRRIGPTNILSFPGGEDMNGSLMLSLPCLLRESRLYGQDVVQYLLHLLSHGIAHLAGYDHGPEMEDFIAGLKHFYFLSRNH